MTTTVCARCGKEENFGHSCDLEAIACVASQKPHDWPTPLADAAIRDLMQGNGAMKHGDEWMTREDQIDWSHADVHRERYLSEDYPDYDRSNGGHLHLTSSICRQKFILERRLRRDRGLAKDAD